MTAALRAYNAGMRRGWLILLMVVLAANGFAPCALLCGKCQNDNRHSCCSPAAKVQADCCAGARGSIAVAAEPQRDSAAPAAVLIGVEVALSIDDRRVSASDLPQFPPGLLTPPIVLRI